MSNPQVELLRHSPLFAGLGAGVLHQLADAAELFALPGGTVLCEQGETSDAVYLVVNGALAAVRVRVDGTERPLGLVFAGETVGEMGLLRGLPRAARVRAVRDSELLRLPGWAFEEALMREPRALMGLVRLALNRAETWQRPPGAHHLPRTLTVVPVGASDARHLVARLASHLSGLGRIDVVGREEGEAHDSAWFSRLEQSAALVIYLADPHPSQWSERCLRQADALVIYATEAPQPGQRTALHNGRPPKLDRPEFVLLESHRGSAGVATQWRIERPRARVLHLDHPGHLARFARILSGRSTGLVLSGGGARGFAHIGAIRALREFGVEFDQVAGSSVGAIIGAGVALEWDDDQLAERCRHSFVVGRPLRDVTFPFVALTRGARVSRLLREAFGEGNLEDLPTPMVCVSTDLTSGRVVEHTSGSLWQALRASCSIPGIFPPVLGGGSVLVDGGVINNFPVDSLRALGVGRIIGIEVSADHALRAPFEETELPRLARQVWQWFRGKRRPDIGRILLRSGMVNSVVATEHNRETCDLLLQPPLAGIDMLEWDEFERAVDAGYRHAREVLPQKLEALAHRSVTA